jgi:hypothetical protein
LLRDQVLTAHIAESFLSQLPHFLRWHLAFGHRWDINRSFHHRDMLLKVLIGSGKLKSTEEREMILHLHDEQASSRRNKLLFGKRRVCDGNYRCDLIF